MEDYYEFTPNVRGIKREDFGYIIDKAACNSKVSDGIIKLITLKAFGGVLYCLLCEAKLSINIA